MQEAGKPLTVEQLREMDGKPVKVVYDEAAKKTTWQVLRIARNEMELAEMANLLEKDGGETR